jgi:hypothetical protein
MIVTDNIMALVEQVPYKCTPAGIPCLLLVFIDATQTYLIAAVPHTIDPELKAGHHLIGVLFLDKRDDQWTVCAAGDERCHSEYAKQRRHEALVGFTNGEFGMFGAHA